MNRFIFLCHVREDEGRLTPSLARSLAARGLKVVYRSISPWLPSDEPRGVLREEVQTGLLECCYGVILMSRAFLSRNWPTSELREIVSRVVGGRERLIHVWHDVAEEDISSFYSPLLSKPGISLDTDFDQTAYAVLDRIAEDYPAEYGGFLAQINPKTLRLFACRECQSQSDLVLECTTAPPIGTTGMLVCSRCGRGYAIRSIPQLLGEGAVQPDEPSPPDLQPLVDIGPLD